jgi:hypothetical protein
MGSAKNSSDKDKDKDNAEARRTLSFAEEIQARSCAEKTLMRVRGVLRATGAEEEVGYED